MKISFKTKKTLVLAKNYDQSDIKNIYIKLSILENSHSYRYLKATTL